MAAKKEKIDVQGYLAKHRVAALLEDLMAKVIKQLPNDPVEFLIRKLQTLHQKQKKTSVPAASISPVKAVPPGSKIQVTGTTVTSKSSKLPISDHLSKSTSGLRPIKAKSVGQPSATLSKTAPTRGSQTTPIRGSHAAREAVRPATSSGSKIGTLAAKPKPASSISRPLSSSTRPSMARPSTAPDPPRSKASQLPVRSANKGSPSIHKRKLPPPPASSSPRAPSKLTPAKPVPKSSEKAGSKLPRDAPKEEDDGGKVGVVKEADEVQIDEFFGEGRKSSQKTYSWTEEEREEMGGAFASDEDDQDEGHVPDYHDQEVVEEFLVRKVKKKRDRHQALQDLMKEEGQEDSTLTMGYHDSSDSSSDGEAWLEDEDTLRDEGVVVARGARAVPQHSMSTVTMGSEGVLCARCSRALGDAESALSVPTSSAPFMSDFESASQVAGQVSFPHWTAEGVQSDLTSSSQLTFSTEDTWGGLTPAAAPQLHSDEESEVHLPVAAPLQSHAWPATDTPPQNDPHGWGRHN